MEKHEAGAAGEKAAADFLIGKGYDILERNYRIRQGEIDLVARDAGAIVFVEVKMRTGAFMLPREAVDERKQSRLKFAANHYLARTGQGDSFCRFDVIEVTPGGITHIENAFE